MGKSSNDPLAVIGGLLVLVMIVCPFFAIWHENYRLHWGLTAVWAAILVYIIVRAIKLEPIGKRGRALIFVEHIEKHLRQWEKDKNFEEGSLKVMCKICDKPIDEIVKEKGAS